MSISLAFFLLLKDDERFKTLKKTLNNNFLLGRQEFPTSALDKIHVCRLHLILRVLCFCRHVRVEVLHEAL